MSDDNEYHIRLVTLGGGGVGKTSIVKRFLYNTYCERHKPTVEDFHNRKFEFSGITLKVDFVDTAGDLQFPAMRRLSIANAQAVLLIYSIEDPSSFDMMKQCFEEVREQKPDYQEIPIMVVGNKLDLEEKRRIKKEDVAEWMFCELPRIRAKLMECSAKDNVNIREIFKSFLQLSKIPLSADTTSLRRRSSAHVTVGRQARFNASLSPQREQAASEEPTVSSPKIKPRSRSLIRRTSRKIAKLKEGVGGSSHGSSTEEDCSIS
ncbi:ras-related protein Rap-1b-like [Centruroides sculpturatus]|uniref:ras-related protein Rap-1b-like n=1 Tax=Centruroides sculpturatus TaxID=218467 RepID=UPI000C6E84EF|nr:ras-related protein Rap-1b-like [Centruroides sculpturatus]